MTCQMLRRDPDYRDPDYRDLDYPIVVVRKEFICYYNLFLSSRRRE